MESKLMPQLSDEVARVWSANDHTTYHIVQTRLNSYKHQIKDIEEQQRKLEETMMSENQQLEMVEQRTKLAQESLRSHVKTYAAKNEQLTQKRTGDSYGQPSSEEAKMDKMFVMALDYIAEFVRKLDDHHKKKDAIPASYATVVYTDEDVEDKPTLECKIRISESTRFYDIAVSALKELGIDESPEDEWELFCDETGRVWAPHELCEQKLLSIKNPRRACHLRKVPRMLLKARDASLQLKEAAQNAQRIGESQQRVKERVKKIEEANTHLYENEERRNRTSKVPKLRESIFHIIFTIFFVALMSLRNPVFKNHLIISAITDQLGTATTRNEIGLLERVDLASIDTFSKVVQYISGPLHSELVPDDLYNDQQVNLSADARGRIRDSHVVEGPIRLLQVRRAEGENCVRPLHGYPAYRRGSVPSPPPPPGAPLQQPASPPPLGTPNATWFGVAPELLETDPYLAPKCFGNVYSQQPFGIAAGVLPHFDGDEVPVNVNVTSAFSWRDGGLDDISVRGYGPGGYYFDTLNARQYQDTFDAMLFNDWIDENSAALLVKFHLRALNDAAITQVALVFEFLPAGNVLSSLELRMLRYSDEIDEGSRLWHDFLLGWTIVMTLYYFYLQMDIFRYAKKAWRHGRTISFLTSSGAILNSVIAVLLILSLVLNHSERPGVQACANCPFESIRDIAQHNFSDFDALNKKSPRWDEVIAGNTTWLTALEYPHWQGFEFHVEASRIDALIFLLLVLKTLRLFSLNKVFAIAFDALVSAIHDLSCTTLIFLHFAVVFAVLLAVVMSYDPSSEDFVGISNLMLTVGYMGVGYFNEVDHFVIESAPFTGARTLLLSYCVALHICFVVLGGNTCKKTCDRNSSGLVSIVCFNVGIWFCLVSLPLAIISEVIGNSSYLLGVLRANEKILKQLDALKKKDISQKFQTFLEKTQKDAMREFKPFVKGMRRSQESSSRGLVVDDGLEKQKRTPLRSAMNLRLAARNGELPKLSLLARLKTAWKQQKGYGTSLNSASSQLSGYFRTSGFHKSDLRSYSIFNRAAETSLNAQPPHIQAATDCVNSRAEKPWSCQCSFSRRCEPIRGSMASSANTPLPGCSLSCGQSKSSELFAGEEPTLSAVEKRSMRGSVTQFHTATGQFREPSKEWAIAIRESRMAISLLKSSSMDLIEEDVGGKVMSRTGQVVDASEKNESIEIPRMKQSPLERLEYRAATRFQRLSEHGASSAS